MRNGVGGIEERRPRPSRPRKEEKGVEEEKTEEREDKEIEKEVKKEKHVTFCGPLPSWSSQKNRAAPLLQSDEPEAVVTMPVLAVPSLISTLNFVFPVPSPVWATAAPRPPSKGVSPTTVARSENVSSVPNRLIHPRSFYRMPSGSFPHMAPLLQPPLNFQPNSMTNVQDRQSYQPINPCIIPPLLLGPRSIPLCQQKPAASPFLCP